MLFSIVILYDLFSFHNHSFICKTTVFLFQVHVMSVTGNRQSKSSDVIISLLDLNDNDPVFVGEPYTINISKNYTIKSPIDRVITCC